MFTQSKQKKNLIFSSFYTNQENIFLRVSFLIKYITGNPIQAFTL